MDNVDSVENDVVAGQTAVIEDDNEAPAVTAAEDTLERDTAEETAANETAAPPLVPERSPVVTSQTQGTVPDVTPTQRQSSSASAIVSPRGRASVRDMEPQLPARCINPSSDVNARLDTQVEVKVYPCNNSQNGKKKFTTFNVKPEGVIIQGNNKTRSGVDLGHAYASHIGRKLGRYELSDSRACQLLVTTHGKNFWVVPAPEAFSRHSGTCRLLGDRKHPPASHTLQVGDFLRVGSVGVVVIETHDGVENKILSEEKIQRIMKDTTNSGGFLDLAETDGGM